MFRARPTAATMASLATWALASCSSSGNAPAERPETAARDASADPGTDAATDIDTDVSGEAPREAGYGNDGGPCLPGVPRCHGDFGYQMCDQDGTWSESHSCAGYSSNGTTSYCAEIPMEGGGTWATCVDPACWYWLGRGALGGPTPVGICETDGSFQACNAGGTLAPASCDGVCTTVTTLDGRAVGACAPECQEGAKECLGGPFYRACAKGRWGANPGSCDALDCNPVATGAVPAIRCGGPCDPGTSRCRADRAAVEVCVPGGTWTTDRTCLLGRCRQAGPQAECETECAPGAHDCAFDGATSQRVCGDNGLWLAEAPCPDGTSCRFAGDEARGCVACVGAHASGGNAFGAVDSRCSPGGVETCSADDRWEPEDLCPDGNTCAALTRGPSSTATCYLLP
jgi:hypothetical protein